MHDIRTITQTGTRRFKIDVPYKDDFFVNADDELGAYKEAILFLEEKDMNTRYTLLCCTVALVTFICAITYGCSQPSQLEVCLAKGKRWSEVQTDNNHNDNIKTPTVHQTICQ